MSKKLFYWLGLTSALTLPAAASANLVTLTFEGIATYPAEGYLVNNYYNGGTSGNNTTGPDYGISFAGDGRILCLNTPYQGGSTDPRNCHGNASRGTESDSQWYGFWWSTDPQGTDPIMNVAKGFTDELSFVYSNPFNAEVTVEIYDGLNGGGTLLTSLRLAQTVDGTTVPALCPETFAHGANYCNLVSQDMTFSGTGKSVVFNGSPTNRAVFDDITLNVPEPATVLLVAAGAGLAGFARGRRRQPAAS